MKRTIWTQSSLAAVLALGGLLMLSAPEARAEGDGHREKSSQSRHHKSGSAHDGHKKGHGDAKSDHKGETRKKGESYH
jgi:hypothetical protein